MIKKNFLANKIPKENKHYACIACVTIDSVMRIEKKNYLQVFWKSASTKQRKQSKFINTELESESESVSKYDAELMAKLESTSDSDSE